MTDKYRSARAAQERARAEAQAERERSRARVLAELRITPPQAALFNVIHYGITGTPSCLPSFAARPTFTMTGPLTEAECQTALSDCLARGWLQVIDEPALARIAVEIRDGNFVGPIYGLPQAGGVDFTHEGAELWHRLCRRCFPTEGPAFAFTDVVHMKSTRFFRTRAAALAAVADEGLDSVATVTGPTVIGPWRVQWWRRFPEGYRLDIEERMRRQGRGGGSGEHFYLSRPRRQADPQRLCHVLNCHNVALGEWLLLATVESQPCYASLASLPRWAAGSADDQFRVTISEEECRAGLEACLRYGWLRLVDRQAVDEIQALLRTDPVFLPVPSLVLRDQGWIDFTPRGAMLYRMIAAEWLGPEWEDDLQVGNDCYREEHRYCETEEGLQVVLQEHAARGEVVRTSRLVPLGPWCVYWWERFPAGFRLELKIGEP